MASVAAVDVIIIPQYSPVIFFGTRFLVGAEAEAPVGVVPSDPVQAAEASL
jgi:hypothetical protein